MNDSRRRWQEQGPPPDVRSLPFALRVPGESRTGGPRSALCREHDVRGLASIRGAELVLEWSGTTRVSEVRGFAAEVRREPFPPGRRAIPLAALASIRRRGWWWRPRVELRVAALDALRGVPGTEGPLLALMVDRADLKCAGRLVLTLAARPAPVHYRSDP